MEHLRAGVMVTTMSHHLLRDVNKYIFPLILKITLLGEDHNPHLIIEETLKDSSYCPHLVVIYTKTDFPTIPYYPPFPKFDSKFVQEIFLPNNLTPTWVSSFIK